MCTVAPQTESNLCMGLSARVIEPVSDGSTGQHISSPCPIIARANKKNKGATNDKTVRNVAVTGDKSRGKSERGAGGESTPDSEGRRGRRSESPLVSESAFPAALNLSARIDYRSPNTGV